MSNLPRKASKEDRVRNMPLFIFDKDSTLIAGLDNRPANTPAEQRVLPGVVEKLAALRAAGQLLAIASNQGGVAWGFLSYAQAAALLEDCAEKVGGVAAWAFCPHDPRAAVRRPVSSYACECACRKPKPGLLHALMHQLGASPEDTFFIGDDVTDAQAAQAAGIHFVWAKDFFEEEK